MARRYDDVIDVRAAPDDASGAPAAFIWRGRLYVVRAVLGHWRERRAWWLGAAARAVHGEELGPEPEPGDAQTEPRPVPPGEEHEVWRVEASPGRVAGPGIYDLRRDPPSARDLSAAWRLLRVAD